MPLRSTAVKRWELSKVAVSSMVAWRTVLNDSAGVIPVVPSWRRWSKPVFRRIETKSTCLTQILYFADFGHIRLSTGLLPPFLDPKQFTAPRQLPIRRWIDVHHIVRI
jgi:hypothetical protein